MINTPAGKNLAAANRNRLRQFHIALHHDKSGCSCFGKCSTVAEQSQVAFQISLFVFRFWFDFYVCVELSTATDHTHTHIRSNYGWPHWSCISNRAKAVTSPVSLLPRPACVSCQLLNMTEIFFS